MKNVFKTFGSIVLTALLIFSTTACGGDEDAPNNGNGNSNGGGTGGGGTGSGGNTTPQTPISADFDIENMTQFALGITAVTITPKAGKSGGAITVYYEGTSNTKTTTVPQVVGSYTVTFDVAATTGWNTASGLNAGTLTITDYNLGDTGPGRGKIFYRNVTGFTMTDTNETCHYLEAAPNSIESLAWASSAYIPPDYSGTGDWVYISGTAEALGTGRKNTALILAKDPDAPAAKACKDYTGGGKTDWFLPSIYELDWLDTRKNYVDNFAIYSSGASYVPSHWSSSEINSDEYFSSSGASARYGGSAAIMSGSSYLIEWRMSDGSKSGLRSVRAIRAF